MPQLTLSGDHRGQLMTITRRDFISTVSLSLAAGAVTSDSSAETAKLATAVDYGDWSVVRDQFDFAPGWVQMSQFYIVSHPRPVREAVERYRRAIDANPFRRVSPSRGIYPCRCGERPLDTWEASPTK